MHRFRFLPSYHYADSTDGVILHPAELTLRDYTITGSADGVGDCAEKRSDIPADYEQLSYLESTATQYINTGIMHGDIAGFDIKYRSTGSNAQNNVLGLDGVMGVNGVMVSSTNPRGDLKIWFANNPSGTGTSTKIGVQVAYPTAGTNWSKSYDSLDSYYATIHHVKLTTDGTLYYNEEAVQEDIVPATPSSSLSVYLFRAHNISNPESGKYRFYSYTRMYYAKFYGADGALLGDFIPCKRRSDGVLGMYDAVSGTFFTNKGTGTFLSAPLTYKIPILNNGTVAAEVVRNAPLYAGESISCRADGLPKVPLSRGSNALTIGTAVQPGSVTYRYDTYGTIPAAYEQLSYLKSTGTQYIDTGVIPTENTGAKVKWSATEFGYRHVLSARTDQCKFYVPFYQSGWKAGWGIASTTSLSYETSPVINEVWISGLNYQNDKSATLNGAAVAALAGAFSSTMSDSLTLFTANTSDGETPADANNFKGKIYGCVITEEKTVIRYFIPCKRRSDGVLGMYDTVGNTFYTNQGTGTFLSE